MSLHLIRSFILGLSFACTSLFAAPILPPLLVDVTGATSFGSLGNTGNTVLSFNIGANTTVTSLSWNFQLTADPSSLLSEIRLRFAPLADEGLILSPALGDDFAGTGTYAGMVDLAALDLEFSVGSDGILRLEFYDDFEDLPFDIADAQWDFGTLTFGLEGVTTDVPGSDVPEPGTWVLMAVGLLLMANSVRHRRPR